MLDEMSEHFLRLALEQFIRRLAALIPTYRLQLSLEIINTYLATTTSD